MWLLTFIFYPEMPGGQVPGHAGQGRDGITAQNQQTFIVNHRLDSNHTQCPSKSQGFYCSHYQSTSMSHPHQPYYINISDNKINKYTYYRFLSSLCCAPLLFLAYLPITVFTNKNPILIIC